MIKNLIINLHLIYRDLVKQIYLRILKFLFSFLGLNLIHLPLII